MTLPTYATLIAAGYAPVQTPLGWTAQTGPRCFCLLPRAPLAMLCAAAELTRRCEWGQS